jgi:hypothetical protein
MRRFSLISILALTLLAGCDPQSQVTEREKQEFTALPSGGLFFSTSPAGIETMFEPKDGSGKSGTFKWTENGAERGGSYEVTGDGAMTMTFEDTGAQQATFTRSGLEMTITLPDRTVQLGMQ